MSDHHVPEHVVEWVRRIFGDCDRRIVQKLQNNPNAPEESLDLTWIEHLSQFSSPVSIDSDWTAKIESHYLGGLRHFYRWEIADIGVLLFVRRSGSLTMSKVALLQSKRLYPTSNRVIEEGQVDYEIGFARIADPEDLARSIAVQHEFEFDADCKYGALKAKSEQVSAIDEYVRKEELTVYYQFYNPWSLPFLQRVPIATYSELGDETGIGTRIIPARAVHSVVKKLKKGASPTLAGLSGLVGTSFAEGWPLAHFIADLFLGCKEGSRFKGIGEERIQSLFYRRSGPIAAAIAISIEGP